MDDLVCLFIAGVDRAAHTVIELRGRAWLTIKERITAFNPRAEERVIAGRVVGYMGDLVGLFIAGVIGA